MFCSAISNQYRTNKINNATLVLQKAVTCGICYLCFGRKNFACQKKNETTLTSSDTHKTIKVHSL